MSARIPLGHALLCADCSTVYDVLEYPKCCPVCTSKFYVKLAAILHTTPEEVIPVEAEPVNAGGGRWTWFQ